MLSSLFINNFRSFKDENFSLSRVNILIGENSSGKSSFLKLLLALKQTLENPLASNLMLNGELADLGNYKETIHLHNENESITFGLSFGKELYNYFIFFYDLEHSLKLPHESDDLWESRSSKNKKIHEDNKLALQAATSIQFTLDKELNTQKSINTHIMNNVLGEVDLEINDFNPSMDIKDGMNLLSIRYTRKQHNDTILLQNIRYEKKGFLSIVTTEDLKKEIERLNLDANTIYELSIFLLNQNLVELALYRCNYLNPLSSKPQRLYYKKDIQSSYKETNLEKVVNSITNRIMNDDSIREFSKVLESYGIADELLIKEAVDLPVTEIRVKVNNLISNINDVGYGVSLQIPMLFDTFLSEKTDRKDIYLIEQPEVHLHPSLQAQFIKTLLEMGKKNQYIIETHSEYIVRKLQVLVKQGFIAPNDVCIYYFAKGKNSTASVTKHNINASGHLDVAFPEGFYDNSYELTKSLLF